MCGADGLAVSFIGEKVISDAVQQLMNFNHTIQTDASHTGQVTEEIALGFSGVTRGAEY